MAVCKEPHRFEAGDGTVGELRLQLGHLALPRALHEAVVLARQQRRHLKVERVLLLLLKHALRVWELRRAIARRKCVQRPQLPVHFRQRWLQCNRRLQASKTVTVVHSSISIRVLRYQNRIGRYGQTSTDVLIRCLEHQWTAKYKNTRFVHR